MIGYPFDSKLIYEDDGTPIYDRAINSSQLRKLYRTLHSNGVPREAVGDGQLKVLKNSEMKVEVNAGFCIVHGVLKWFEEQTILEVPRSEDQDRIDTVVIRMDDRIDVRSCELYVKKGVKSNSPVRPELTRTDTIFELGIADIYVSQNEYKIEQDKITDTRGDSARCGFISTLGLEAIDYAIPYPVDGSGVKIIPPSNKSLVSDGRGGVKWEGDFEDITLTVTYSFWSNDYTPRTQTREVTWEGGVSYKDNIMLFYSALPNVSAPFGYYLSDTVKISGISQTGIKNFSVLYGIVLPSSGTGNIKLAKNNCTILDDDSINLVSPVSRSLFTVNAVLIGEVD